MLMLIKHPHTLTYQVFAEDDHIRLTTIDRTVKIWMHDRRLWRLLDWDHWVSHLKDDYNNNMIRKIMVRTFSVGCGGFEGCCDGCSTGTAG